MFVLPLTRRDGHGLIRCTLSIPSPPCKPCRTPQEGDGDWLPLSFAALVRILRVGMEGLQQAEGYHFLRYYLAGVLRDVCHWPVPLDLGRVDPYLLLDYLSEAERQS